MDTLLLKQLNARERRNSIAIVRQADSQQTYVNRGYPPFSRPVNGRSYSFSLASHDSPTADSREPKICAILFVSLSLTFLLFGKHDLTWILNCNKVIEVTVWSFKTPPWKRLEQAPLNEQCSLNKLCGRPKRRHKQLNSSQLKCSICVDRDGVFERSPLAIRQHKHPN